MPNPLKYNMLMYTKILKMLKNITLGADQKLIKKAREKAKKEPVAADRYPAL